MKSLMLVALLAVGALGVVLPSADLDAYWLEWKDTNSKTYDNAFEESQRRTIWEANLKTINAHNQEYSLGKTTFLMTMNEFGDLTNAEFVASRNGFKKGRPSVRPRTSTFLPPSFMDLPTSVDWRKEGYVTPVKNQEACGSCWAFSTVAALEGQHFKKTQDLVSLSEQNLVDCSQAEGNEGCNGGWPVWAYNYILKNGGIDTEAGYPYVGKDQQCQYSTSDIGATITGITEVEAKSETALEQAIATVGPISVCIDASHGSFQLYASGVYQEPACSSTLLDHCVTAVGYDVTAGGEKYYIVKNSWGADWGQEGYIWMSRENNNNCGIATNASYPLV